MSLPGTNPYANDSGVATLDTLGELRKEKATIQKQLTALKSQYAHHRFKTYQARKNFLTRIRKTERALHAVLAELTALQKSSKYALYTKLQPKTKGGINVTVELSLDGTIFSNPAPAIPNGKYVWVRCTIDDAHRGDAGVPKTHELAHLNWVHTVKTYVQQDTIPSTGHDEYFVSFPLVITRLFRAPASGITRSNWLVYVDVYERVEENRLG